MDYRDVDRGLTGLPRIVLEKKVFLYSMLVTRSLWFLIVLLILVLRVDLLVEKEFVGIVMQVAIAGAGLSATIAAVIAGVGMELEHRLTVSYLIGAFILAAATVLSALSYLTFGLYMYMHIQLILILIIGVSVSIDWIYTTKGDERRYKRHLVLSTIFIAIIIPVTASLVAASLIMFFGGLVFLAVSILVTIYALFKAKLRSGLSPIITAVLEVLRRKLPRPLTRKELEKHLLEEMHLSPEPIDLDMALRVLMSNGHVFKLTIDDTTYYTIMPVMTWRDLEEKIAETINTKAPQAVIVIKSFIKKYLEHIYDEEAFGSIECLTPLLRLLYSLEREIGWKLPVLKRKFPSIDLANYVYETIIQYYGDRGSCHRIKYRTNGGSLEALLCSTDSRIEKLLQEATDRIKGLKIIMKDHLIGIIQSTCRDLGINEDVCECSLTYYFICENVIKESYINVLLIPLLDRLDRKEAEDYIVNALNNVIEFIHRNHRNLRCEPIVREGKIPLLSIEAVYGAIKCRLKESKEENLPLGYSQTIWISKDYIEYIKDYIEKQNIRTLSTCTELMEYFPRIIRTSKLAS